MMDHWRMEATAEEVGFNQVLDPSQHGTTREALKLSVERTSDWRIRLTWIMTLLALTSSRLEVDPWALMDQVSTIQSLLVTQ